MNKHNTKILLNITTLGSILFLLIRCSPNQTIIEEFNEEFNADRAYKDVICQVSLGPRTPSSEAHQSTIDWISKELNDAGWDVETQTSTIFGHEVKNIIGKRGNGTPWLILGAHYDSRLVADRDPDVNNRIKPVPGANDGASGVAVLLELARILPGYLEHKSDYIQLTKDKQIWLVFFDAEDNGNLPNWNWILGSRAFVNSLNHQPDTAIIVDMIGDKDLNIYQEQNSNPDLSNEIWSVARSLDYSDYFIPQIKYKITDDHIPFISAGIRAVDLIDFDYPYWHTTDDTPDKVSGLSLKIVGDTLLNWIMRK